MKRRKGAELSKITLSLPRDLIDYADRCAREKTTSRSEVVSEALAERRAREERELAQHGYQFYATEAQEFANASASATGEAWSHGR